MKEKSLGTLSKGKVAVLGVAVALLAASLSVLMMSLAQPAEAAFPGQNGKIAFQSNRTGNNEVYRMNADGTIPENLTSSSAADHDAAYSADGTKIAFASDRDGNWEVYRMTSTGGSQTRLTFDAGSDYDPTWQTLP